MTYQIKDSNFILGFQKLFDIASFFPERNNLNRNCCISKFAIEKLLNNPRRHLL
jgi:hypothetical protein